MTEQPRRARQQEVVEVVELRMARTAAPPAPQGEHHLGDRLAAFVDGELDHDARERVQSHLATCDACLSRAEDERRIKNRIAAAAPPDPSALFLSKLMSIAPDRDDRPPSGPQPRRGFGGLGGAAFGGSVGGVFGAGGSSSFGSGRFGSGALGAEHPLPGVDPRAERGMQPREESRPIAARLRAGLGPAVDPAGRPSASPRPVAAPAAVSSTPRPSAARGRRFAFAAAGAFSVAAVALGSAITGVTAAEPTVDEPYGSVTPAVDVPAGGFDYVSDTSRLAAAGVPVNASGSGADYSFQQSNGLLRASNPVASATSLPGADQQVLHSAAR